MLLLTITATNFHAITHSSLSGTLMHPTFGLSIGPYTTDNSLIIRLIINS